VRTWPHSSHFCVSAESGTRSACDVQLPAAHAITGYRCSHAILYVNPVRESSFLCYRAECSHLHRMYNTQSRREDVWKRLEADAKYRKQIPSQQYSFWCGHGLGARIPVGYTQSVMEQNLTIPPEGFEMVDKPAERLHRLTLERYRKHIPLEFYAAIRPATTTINQTLRYHSPAKRCAPACHGRV
jgi:hypothetical protein